MQFVDAAIDDHDTDASAGETRILHRDGTDGELRIVAGGSYLAVGRDVFYAGVLREGRKRGTVDARDEAPDGLQFPDGMPAAEGGGPREGGFPSPGSSPFRLVGQLDDNVCFFFAGQSGEVGRNLARLRKQRSRGRGDEQ
jgi:hypothetical protein